MASHLAFIASGGRTGTQFLGDLLANVIEDCHSEHEPDLFLGLNRLTLERVRSFGLWHMVFGRALGLTGVRTIGTRYLKNEITLERARRTLVSQRSKYHGRIEEDLLIESYSVWWIFAPVLKQIFPGSRAVGVVRGPKAWIDSWSAHNPGRDRLPWTHFLPPGPINAPNMKDPLWGPRWDDLGEVGRLAWQWNLINSNIAQAAMPGDLELFRFEDVFDPSSGELTRLIAYICDFPDRMYRYKDPTHLLAEKVNHRPESEVRPIAWSAKERAIVNEICGSLMEQLGYDPL